jgi:hypothetical protein
MKIIFDVDGTIYKISEDRKSQVPDYDLIQVLRWFAANGDDVYVWSGGGVDYAQLIVDRLGLTEIVKCIPKLKLGDDTPVMDLTFDDETIKNGKCNIKVKRPDYDEKS